MAGWTSSSGGFFLVIELAVVTDRRVDSAGTADKLAGGEKHLTSTNRDVIAEPVTPVGAVPTRATADPCVPGAMDRPGQPAARGPLRPGR